MNFDITNDLIQRLVTDEGANVDGGCLSWIDDSCSVELDIGGDREEDADPPIHFRIQRLPKLPDRRSFLVKVTGAGQQDGCVCKQLPYSTCLNVVHERQQKLNWIGDDENGDKDEDTQAYSDLVRHISCHLFSCPFISVNKDGTYQKRGTNDTINRHPNIWTPQCIVETALWFYAVTPVSATKDWVTLRDAAVFSPHVLAGCSDRLLFIIYQLLSALVYCQKESRYLPSDLRLDAVRVNVNDLWCRLDLWRCLRYVAEDLTLKEDSEERWILGKWCDRWTRGLVSNFDYLNILNDFAGRRAGDPCYHPIFPWVCDFTRDPTCNNADQSESGIGWRDLTKTKFRLTKGDQQLEQTYTGQAGRSASISGHPVGLVLLPPHHVTEFLSDIGYYAYKARRTPKSVLCRHVRHRWVPEEYPSSLARLYHWTPDEAIPEFYSDPSIFISIHSDLPHLELPHMLCKKTGSTRHSDDAKRFVEWHKALLECDHVSERLHTWIDLIFGYQLTGQAAITANNVQLHLVERADRLTNIGVVQLFHKPHPRKQFKTKLNSSMSVSVDEVMNPLYDMEHLQTMATTDNHSEDQSSSELTNTPGLPSDVWRAIHNCQVSQKTCHQVRDCLVSVAVLIAELCHWQAFHHLPIYATAYQRLQIARRIVFNGQHHPLARCVRLAVELLLDPDSGNISDELEWCSGVDPAILCPGLVLQPLIRIIPFPYWMAPLFDCFQRVKALETTVVTDDAQLMLERAEKRVRDVAKLLPLVLPNVSMAGVEILSRLTKRALFTDPYARILAMWLLWNPLTQALGPELADKHFTDDLLKLYNVDSPCSSKILKLYHRTFLLQVSVRLGTQRFLDNLIQPLVEAAAGERDGCFYQDEQEYWKAVSQGGKTGNGNAGARHLQNLVLTDMEKEEISVVDSPVERRQQDLPVDESDSIVQFQLDINDENQQHPHAHQSSSFDLDGASTATDAVSIRSSESGLSSSAPGVSGSFSSSRNDTDTQHQHQQQHGPAAVSEVAVESLLWLSHRLGPLLTARHVTSTLLRMLALCYSPDRLGPTGQTTFASSWYPVTGDTGADKVLHCLEEITMIYGEHMILRHYFAYAGELISQAVKRLTPNMEMAVLACVTLIRRMFPYLTHEQLMENLKDHTFIDSLLFPLIRQASSIKVTFSSTAARTALTWKLAECLYWLGVRVGAENIKSYLLVLIQRLFCTYDLLYQLRGDAEILIEAAKMPEWSDAAFIQLKATFTPVLASRMMKTFGTLCGKQYLQLSLSNTDILTKICDKAETGPSGGFQVDKETTSPVEEATQVDSVCKRLKHSSRKLKGTWLAYWEYELGRNPKDCRFNFKHMKLQSFIGHTGSIRKICVLDNENSFFSAGQDKTVRLWSVRSTGDGGARTSCQYSYKAHKRPLSDAAFIDSLRLVASVDGNVHIWDPFMGVPIREFDFADITHESQQLQQQSHSASMVAASSAPSTTVLVAGTFPFIKFLDVRQARWAHEFTLGFHRNQATSGPVRALCVDASGSDRWVAVGHGLGHVSTLDLRTGRLLGQVKLCETDIFAMSPVDKDTFVVCAFDQPLHLVRARDCTLRCRMPGTSDAVTCCVPFYRELICATQSNKLRFYSSVQSDAAFTDSKLRADVFAGSISSLCALPLNRLLLMGSTNGNIELLC